MSEHQQKVSSSIFEGVKVSKGFVRGLQGQVFKLEQNMQGLIAQLEHTNALTTEFHETSVIYQRKYDQALHQMEEMKRLHENEKAMMNFEIQHLNAEAAYEKEMNQDHSNQITMLELQLAQQVEMTQMQTMQTMQTMQSQATTVENMGLYARDYYDQDRDELSPVSVSSPSPMTPMTPRAQRVQTPTLDAETPTTEEEDEYQKDPAAYWQKAYPKWAQEYHEESKKQEADTEAATEEEDDHMQTRDEWDNTDWEQKEREDWTESLHSYLSSRRRM